ncbi:sulfate adenylyltransferase [Evansella tamaricis]|uniref:Sulfate adenylyltransferase n=1 Tax=Evansella tamaricis TaxID=2069301 RepID=A0ABS6JLK7_9BACI|nr:sulfate adenylyltransferase [Evansella tamaricis]MBU9713315.1 sulfate adenylyltransferase [Evansella tamaricis]
MEFGNKPHGGELINLFASNCEKKELILQEPEMKRIYVDERVKGDLLLLANGAYSPLTGFMGKKDYECVLDNMKLANGLIWPIPITFPVSKETAVGIKENERIALFCPKDPDRLLAVLDVKEKYSYCKTTESSKIYQTADQHHPGVAKLMKQGEILIGGPIKLVNRPFSYFPVYDKDPMELRQLFKEKGWTSVTAFQTRNPIHRAHEYIQKCALELTDALFLHPLIGTTKSDDIPANVRMKSYEKLIENYYPSERTCLSVFPAAMRYAGPREAVFHAICRKNYGCTHMIIGRDHAGVGDYYGTYDAQDLIRSINQKELGIIPLCFEHSFFCNKCNSIVSKKTCPHPTDNHLILSGTAVRQKLMNGETLPVEFTRPEVAKILQKAYVYNQH